MPKQRPRLRATKRGLEARTKGNRANGRRTKGNTRDGAGEGLRLWDKDAYDEPFAAPWSPGTVAGTLAAFAVAYPVSGGVLAPWVGQHVFQLPPLVQTFGNAGDAGSDAMRALWRVQYAFVGQSLETTVAIAGAFVLARTASAAAAVAPTPPQRPFGPFARKPPQPEGAPLFRLDATPFGPSAWNLRDGWLTWTVVGYPLAVGSVALASLATVVLTHGQGFQGRGTADDVVKLLRSSSPPPTKTQEMRSTVQGAEGRSAPPVAAEPRPAPPPTPVTTSSAPSPTLPYLLGIASVLAPAAEELIFRGFLLAALTRFMSPANAAFVSAGAFACAHLSARDLPQLWALGIVLGLTYVRTKNLATPIAIHAVWNGMTLLVLVALQQ